MKRRGLDQLALRALMKATHLLGLVLPPEPAREPGRAVRARDPNHVRMADLTEVPSLFSIFSLKLAVVFDAFSRLPLAFRVFAAPGPSP